MIGDLTELAMEKAQAILGQGCSPFGLMASPKGYPHVWARDSVITSLGALLSAGHEHFLRVSLATLAGQPMGYPQQPWSAGMYNFACRCVAEEMVALL